MELLIALIALAAMEIVLGIDNIVFIAIVTSRLPADQQPKARKIGLFVAMLMRIALLFTLSLILQADEPFYDLSEIGFPKAEWIAEAEAQLAALPTEYGHETNQQRFRLTTWIHTIEEMAGVSWKDIILLAGGLFLIQSSVREIHEAFHGGSEHTSSGAVATFGSAIATITGMDIVFSIDSVITAVGMVEAEGEGYLKGLSVMIAAIVLAVGVMMVFAEPVSKFVASHPTLKMLALSFLILIGVMLVAEGIGTHFNKGYIYFAMAFAIAVELLNLRLRHSAESENPA
ncbi:MAG: TerC family protein [Planctomycetaceae bacterium]|nr:TerC family protein [Planctomycetales bacterium]MCB9925751.1 TerC family protein [Planctomycetaceae bacterium]